MNPHSDEFYHAAIKIAYPYACDIRKPLINGAVSPLFIGDTPHGTIVCKFGDADIVMRNRVLSELLAMNNMPTPQTTTHAYLGAWFESYEYCPDLTLAEYIQSGKITDTQIFDVYRQVTDVQYKISQINPVEFQPKTHRYFSDVFKTTIQMNIKKPLADVYAWLYKQLSQYGTTRLLHNDVHPGNILIDTQYRLTRLIDLDGISLCNDDCSMMQTLRTYPLNNYDEYIEYYQDITGRQINRKFVMGLLGLIKKSRKHRRKLDAMFWDNKRSGRPR